ncbi:hypothetical protein [Serratia fonticola]|uniref:hypothetical protein n=1 Tax=Serratia fonticola TaxID=47917 RepID=UPI0034C62DCA
MSDKLEALSQPVAVMYADGYVMTREECGNTFAACCQTQSPLYSQEYVTALIQRAEAAEQRLQQPIKLPKSGIGMACKFVGDHIVVSLAAVLVETAMAGFKAEVEGE